MPKSHSECIRNYFVITPRIILLLSAFLLPLRVRAELPGPGFPPALTDWAPNEIHQYTDATACEWGTGDDKYLPTKVVPSGTEIPITWNGATVTWDKNQYLIDGMSAKDLPKDDPKYAEAISQADLMPNGIFDDPKGKGLKCDHMPYVRSSCVTGQYVKEVDTGDIRWVFLFRRTAAPAVTDPIVFGGAGNNWDEQHALYYQIVDVGALKTDFYGAAWWDSNDSGGGGRSPTNGFVNGQDIPRAGGKHPYYRKAGVRASQWYDTPGSMRANAARCDGCHGTPFNGSEWLKQQSAVKLGNDQLMPFWNTGNDVLQFLPEKTYFKTASNADKVETSCTKCHPQWMQGSSSSPGDPGFSDAMTLRGSAMNSRFSFWASQARDAATGIPMPPGGATTEKEWNNQYLDDYNLLACCANPTGVRPANPGDPKPDCTGVRCEWDTGVPPKTGSEVSKPDFYTGWMAKKGYVPKTPPANGKVYLPGPETATATKVLGACPPALFPGAGANDQCLELTWQDTGNPFTAAPAWYWTTQRKAIVGNPPWPIAEADTEWCPAGAAQVPYQKITQLGPDANGDKWRFEYKAYVLVPWCQMVMVRFCGGWCSRDTNKNKDPNAQRGQQIATDIGQVFKDQNGTVDQCTAKPSPTQGPTPDPDPGPTSTSSPAPTLMPALTPAPTGFSTSGAFAPGAVTLGWDPVPGATTLVLDLSTDGVIWTGTVTLGGGATSYNMSALAPNTLYTFRLVAYFGANAASPIYAIQLTSDGIPSSVRAVATSDTEVSLSWSHTGNPSLYRIRYHSDSDPTSVQMTTFDSPASFANLTTGDTYYFWVVAVFPGGDSQESLAASVRVLAPPLTSTLDPGATPTPTEGSATPSFTPF